MPVLTAYKGVDVVEGATGAAGAALTSDLKKLADRAPMKAAVPPAATDNAAAGYFPGALWLDTATQTMWVYVSESAGAAVWKSLYKRTGTALTLIPAESGEAVSVGGALGVGTAGTPSGKLEVQPGAAGTKGLVVRLAAGPTANALEVQDSTGAALSAFDKAGGLAGRAQMVRYKSGLYYPTYNSHSVATSAGSGNGNLRAHPVYVPTTMTLSALLMEVTAAGDAGCGLRLGIYNDTGSGFPNALVLDAGTIAGDVVAVGSITVSQTLAPGLYWFAYVLQGVTVTQPTIRIVSTASVTSLPIGSSTAPAAGAVTFQGYTRTGVTGALPSTWGAGNGTGGLIPRMFFKVA